MAEAPPTGRGYAALAGVVALAAALGAAQLTTALGTAFRTPVLSVANAVVRYSPDTVTSWTIELFGTYDKLVLRVGLYAVLTGMGAALGVLARRRLAAAAVGTLLLGGVGVLAALDDGAGVVAAVLPSATAVVVGLPVLALLILALGPKSLPAGVTPAGGEEAVTPADGEESRTPAGDDQPVLTRRRFVKAAGAVAVLAAGAHALGRSLEAGVQATAQRARVVLPTPGRRMDLPVPEAAHPDVAGLSKFVSPNDEFYRIDTALRVPRPDPGQHTVRVTGMVARELTIPFRRLLDQDMVALPMSLMCVSNEVGGDLVDAAVWQGVLLRDVLDEAGVADDATQVVGRSVDGYTCGFPVEAAYDRPTLIAVGMNGEPLPAEHGFPVRLVTPGLYGYVGATKWLAEIELTRFDEFTQYWANRGWAERGPVKISSRIEVPAPSTTVAAGTVAVAGTAWAPTRGVGRVEVRVDDGDWREAELAASVNGLTWRQWVYRWEASPGSHDLAVRAADTGGEAQVGEPSPPRPDGATGYHTVSVTVDEA